MVRLMCERRWRQLQSEISINILKQHAEEFPEPVRTLILQEKERVEIEKLLADLGTFETILRLKKER